MSKDTLTELALQQSAPHLAPGIDAPFWQTYKHHGLANLSPTAAAVVELDARFVAERCVLAPGGPSWAVSRVRTGIVVGAVQSGKTASMLAVSALLLDAGVDVLVVLAGTRIALWRQTYQRVLEQLDGSTAETASDRFDKRLIIPNPCTFIQGERSSPGAYMASAASDLERAIENRRPVLLIIPKHQQHLLVASRTFEEHIGRALKKLSRCVHMVVLDDEADDGSVLDAADSKLIPRRVQMLWTGRREPGTFSDQLYATYIAYTATPQANFLQESANPLAPRHFRVALRTPQAIGATTTPRAPTFAEPAGVKAFYCGGDIFYSRAATGNLCVTREFPVLENEMDAHVHGARVRALCDEQLMNGLRSFLVAGAIRSLLGRSKGEMTLAEAHAGFAPAELRRLPPPHCMLVHPSSRQVQQFSEARRLALLSRGIDPDGSQADDADIDDLQVDVAGLKAQLESREEDWKVWLSAFRSTTEGMMAMPGGAALRVPDDDQWPAVRRALEEDVLAHVKLRIINSDPEADDRPRFDPVVDGALLKAPPDLVTIFISGNVMSRGLTIDGLCTSVFTRSSGEPAADTQMQMQRWFGYRGSHIHLCRLFCFSDQLQLFSTYHGHDNAMRREILQGMDKDAFEARPHIVLTGPRSLATAKIPTSRLPLHPGPNPSVKLIEVDDRALAANNANILGDLLDQGDWTPLTVGRSERALIRDHRASLKDVAELLERFRYASHDPRPDFGPNYTRWKSQEDHLNLLDHERPLYRPPGVAPGEPCVAVNGCPYTFAAYLRLWAAALRRPHCDGLYPSGDERSSWALAQPMLTEPTFYLAVRHGEEGVSTWPRLATHRVRAMTRGHDITAGEPRILETLWGTRGGAGEYHGDQLLDYHVNGLPAPLLLGDTPRRPRGHPGLVLFHVIRPPDGPEAVTVGLSLPDGGPEQFAAVRR
ncbi:MAG: hypothetical protein RL685_4941 [Pseudomonadota bacterium]